MRFAMLARSFAVLLGLIGTAANAAPAKFHSMSPRLTEAVDLGRAPKSERHRVVVALDLRNRDALETFLADVQNPASPRYQQFLTQDEFDALYAPTVAQEAAVVDHLRRGGLKVTQQFSNRLLVGATGSVAALERTFGVDIHAMQLDGKRHFAAINEPSFPADIADAVVGVLGLDDLTERHPHVRVVPTAQPRATLIVACCSLSPNDLFTFYDQPGTYSGTGQTIVIAGAYAWQDVDIAPFDAQWGLPDLATGSTQVCTGPVGSVGCQFDFNQSIEISLDVEYAHGTAPAARILNYMSASTANADFTTMYNRVVTDNPGHVVSTSWGECESKMDSATQQANDNIFANANAIGQSWFAASGDNGSHDCGTRVTTVDHPANSPHEMGVGGTTPKCSGGMTPNNPACAGYASETAWSSSGGGVSQVFSRPAFQTGCGVPAVTHRLVPDVALEADTAPGNYVVEGGYWWIVGGTSDAAPQWAGLAAELGQKSGAALGNPGAFLYGLCGTSALHDITSGSNGDYSAGPGYDMVTGLGSFDARNMLAVIGGVTTTSSSTTTSTHATTTVPTTSSTSSTSSSTRPTTTSTTSSTSSTTSSSTTVPTTSSTSSSSTSSSSSSSSTSSSTSSSSTSTRPTTTSTSSSTTTSSTTSSSTTSAPTTSSTSTSTRPTTTSTSTTVTNTSSTTTTTIAACLPTGSACTTNASCCSNSCKVKAGKRQCR